MEESVHVPSFGPVSTRTDILGLRVGMVLACWCVLPISPPKYSQNELIDV